MNDPRDAFREEAFDLLAELETALMELEENPTDTELIDRVFRAMHTMQVECPLSGWVQGKRSVENSIDRYDKRTQKRYK